MPHNGLAIFVPLPGSHVSLDIYDAIVFALLVIWPQSSGPYGVELRSDDLASNAPKPDRDCITGLSILLRRCTAELPVFRELLN